MNIDEQWIEITRERKYKDSIVAISNTGKYRRLDGTIGILSLRQKIRYCGELEYCYRMIAEHFLITVKRPDQNQIDHITHYTNGYNVNNVLNLRWCSTIENSGFEEARNNKSKEKCHFWRGDSATPKGKYKRALNEYRRNPTEENLATLKEARLIRNESERSRKATSIART